MRNRPNISVLDSNEWHFEFSSQSGNMANLEDLPKHPFNEQKPQHGVRRQTAAGTKPMQHGTPMLNRKAQAAGNNLKNGIAAVLGEAAALAKLSRPCTGAPFAHMGQHLMRMGRPQQGHRRPTAHNGSSEAADNILQSSTASQQQHSHGADQGSTSRLEQARMQKDLTERRQDPACSPAQPEAAAKQSRKKRRRASAPFASASAGVEGSSPPGDWKWPELPKWKPPRCSPVVSIHVA